MRRIIPPLFVLGLALLVSACGGAQGSSPSSTRGEASARRAGDERTLVRGAPPVLARLYAQEGDLLAGGPRAFRARLRELRGHPVVINKWASWCGPCRAELPYFRHQALRRGKQVAFLGSNSNDSLGPARRFADEVGIPFPSYEDQSGDIARVFNGTIAFPTTAFYDRRGRLATVKQGGYSSERELAGDIDRYAR